MKRLFALLISVCILFTGCQNRALSDDLNTPSDSEKATYESYAKEISRLINDYTPDEDETNPFYSCRIIVSCRDDKILKNLGAEEIVTSPEGTSILQFRDATQAENAYETIKNMNDVLYAEPDMLVSVDAQDIPVGDECISWGTSACGADKFAQALGQIEHKRITVAVVDTGVSQHQLLLGRTVEGIDLVDLDEDWSDEYGHGTHVAGIIADATRGLKVDILPVRVLNEKGKGFSSLISAGIRSAVACGADVINLSLGKSAKFPLHANVIDEAVRFAADNGAVVVSSAGNDYGDATAKCPAHIEESITVSAIDENYSIASFSNTGISVDFAAPGVNINSSIPGGYETKDGTSMAAPYISALCAMLRAADLANSQKEIENILSSCCLDLGDAGKDDVYGYGLPQIDKLISKLPIPIKIETGVYNSNTAKNDTFTIHSVTEDALVFSVFWYRTNSIDQVTVKMSGNSGSFVWKDDSGLQYAEGTLEILYGNNIVLNLTESSLAYIDPGIYEYQYFGSEEEYLANQNKEILLMNDDISGWCATIEGENNDPNTTELFLRFYEDGRFVGWQLENFGGEASVSSYSGEYSLHGETLYLDGKPYQLFAYSTGVTFMTLKATGNYSVDFSGEYSLKDGTMYSYLVEATNNSWFD